MAMSQQGLTKLLEELGELSQIAAKKIAYIDTDDHPDGMSMKARMEDEMADVMAAIMFVADKFDLDKEKIGNRIELKYARFTEWDNQPGN